MDSQRDDLRDGDAEHRPTTAELQASRVKLAEETRKRLEALEQRWAAAWNSGDAPDYMGSTPRRDPVHSEQDVERALRMPYPYRRLDDAKDEIRLVRISYRTWQQRLAWTQQGHSDIAQCSLEHKKMGEFRGSYTYEAVSYVWGSSERTHRVVCDGCTSSLNITQNLHTVLTRLSEPRRYNSGLPYWLDGICINQEDSEERNHQVRKMISIYRRAARVHVFFGSFDSPDPVLLKSAWLTRRWIIQEAIAAQAVVIHIQMAGSWCELSSWDALRDKIAGFHGRMLVPVPKVAAHFLRDLVSTNRTRWSSIFSLLLKFHTAQCVDDRDRLFALLGISNDVELEDRPQKAPAQLSKFHALKIWFQPDYTLETEQVYLKFAIAAVSSAFVFDLLHCAGAFRRRDGDEGERRLPTWVPDWRCALLHKPLMRTTECRAGSPKGKVRPEVKVDASERALILQGIVISKVYRIMDCFATGKDIPEGWRFVKVDRIIYTTGDDEMAPSIDLSVERAYVELSDGRAAAVPFDVRMGDEVVIFIGAKTPFVLRSNKQSEDGPVTHALIGDCYVADDEVMEGKIAQRALAEDRAEHAGARPELHSCVEFQIV